MAPSGTQDSADIGSNQGTWSPPSARYASTNGQGYAQFYDIPLGNCQNFTFSGWRWALQDISIKIGNMKYPVRQQYWTSSATGRLTGSISNSTGDVSISR